MNNENDVIVIGAGLSGMVAALKAAEEKKKVSLITYGSGCLSIASGTIDLLGYDKNQKVDDPIETIANLHKQHPYQLLGKQNIIEAINWFTKICNDEGLQYKKNEVNSDLITSLGTTKPSFLFPASYDTSCIKNEFRIAVIAVDEAKDVYPKIIIQNLKSKKDFANKEFYTASIPSPFLDKHRNPISLDIAKFVDTPQGYEWLRKSIAPYASLYPCLILPPICGLNSHDEVIKKLSSEYNIHIIEMIAIPPCVSGLRLQNVLRKTLVKKGVNIVENARVIRAEVENNICKQIVTSTSSGTEYYWSAKSFIVATGGILGGGITTTPGKAIENIFNIEIQMPEDTEAWSSKNVFDESLFSSMGIAVNEKLNALTFDNTPILSNVYFCGRILGNYDFSREKSGNGVAIATGWFAGKQACME